MIRPSTPTRRCNARGTGITIGSSKGSSSFFFSSSKNEKVKNMIPTISIRRAISTRLIGPVSTLVVCILICYEGVVITKSYSNKIDRRNQYESNLRHRKLLQERVGSSTNAYTYVDEYTQHNEYTYVDDNEEVNSNDEVDDPLSYEYDNCIVGSGLSGAIIAEQYATKSVFTWKLILDPPFG